MMSVVGSWWVERVCDGTYVSNAIGCFAGRGT